MPADACAAVGGMALVRRVARSVREPFRVPLQ
jgi:hypothetical protein